MSLDKILVIAFGVIGIIFTYWFFLKRGEKEVKVLGEVDILVKGGYEPEVISIPSGKTTKINFLRKDPSTCLEEVIIPEFKVRKFLPLNEKVTIEVTPKGPGEFGFECGMGMFHGKLKVT